MFAAVPGVGYQGQKDVDRRTLTGFDAKPEARTYVFETRRMESLSWQTSKGETSQSPASRHANRGDAQNLDTGSLLRRTYEALELPGTASDYHFILMTAYQTLWTRRGDSPDSVDILEKLCLLDIRLVEAVPEAIRYDSGDVTHAFGVPAFGILAGLYEKNGFLEDALQIHRRGVPLGQGDRDIPQLEERIRELRAEDG